MNRSNKTLYFDVETNGLEDFSTFSDLHTAHCLSIYDPVMQKMVTFSNTDGYDGIPIGLNELDNADTIVGHNVISFDIPALQKLYNWSPKARILDTLVTSRAVHSDLRSLDIAFQSKILFKGSDYYCDTLSVKLSMGIQSQYSKFTFFYDFGVRLIFR